MANIIIKAWFTQSGVPKTGLTPTISIYDIQDSNLDIDGEAMTENGLGWYFFDFDEYDHNHQYNYTIDGSSSLSGSERYQYGELKYIQDS